MSKFNVNVASDESVHTRMPTPFACTACYHESVGTGIVLIASNTKDITRVDVHHGECSRSVCAVRPPLHGIIGTWLGLDRVYI